MATVTGIDIEDAKAFGLCFILDKLLKLAKTPTVQAGAHSLLDEGYFDKVMDFGLFLE